MDSSSSRTLRATLLLILGLLLSTSGCVGPGSGLRSTAEALAGDIYSSTELTLELQVSLVKPLIIRTAVKNYVSKLEVSEEIKDRLRERIEQEEFIDASVPFLYYLMEVYGREDSVESFDDYIRKRFHPADPIPGLEHALFTWQEEINTDEDKSESEQGATLDAVLGGLVQFYDAVFLQSSVHPFKRGRLRDRQTIERTRPIVRDILEKIADMLPPSSEGRKILQQVVNDTERLEALTIAAIDLTREFAFKSYKRFARMATRSNELREWMIKEFEKDGFGILQQYIAYTRSRKYGVLIVADGLQGHLVESLARGSSGSRFIQQISREHRQAQNSHMTEKTTPAPEQQLEFLEYFSRHGFTHKDYLPFLRKLYEKASSGVARGGLSTTPTISVRNIPIALTGARIAGPDAIGVPNFHFLDRDADRAYYFYGNDVLELELITRRAGMKTLFSRLRHLSSLSANAQYDVEAHYSIDSLINLILGENRRDFGERLLTAELERRAKMEIQLDELRERLLELLRLHERTSRARFIARAAHRRRAMQIIEEIARLEDRGMPQILVAYNPWPDHFAHATGPFANAIIAPTGELNRLDYWLGRIDAIYRKAGVHKRTLFGLVGDHGLEPVYYLVNVEEAVFEGLEREGINLRVKKISVDEGEPPSLTNPLRPPSMKGYDLMVSSTAGGNYTMDLFVDQGARWKEQPLYRDLTALVTLEGKTIDIIEEIRKRLPDSLDYLVVREEPCQLDRSAIRLVATREGKRIDERVYRRGTAIFYECTEDLLGISRLSPYDPTPTGSDEVRYQELLGKARKARLDDVTSWLSEDEWRELCSFTDRPDAVVQIAHIYDTDLAGTINLFPAQFAGFNTQVPGRHAGELFHEKDAFVALWGTPVRRTQRPRTAIHGSVAATIYRYLAGKEVLPGKDGWGFEAIEIKKK